jgi:hypothetical protein
MQLLTFLKKFLKKAFKGLYHLWFDEKIYRIQYLRSLIKVRMNLANVFRILSAAGANVATAFKDLYDV